MFFATLQNKAKYLFSVLIGFLFCAIIWLSPESTAPVMANDEFSHLLIIDPGHGGEDGGAVSIDGTVESGINLDIGLRLKDLTGFIGMHSIMTRESELLDYPESASTTAQRKRWDTNRRVELINSYPNGILVSIHQNIYPTSVPSGSQVLYGNGEESRFLGQKLHENLQKALDPSNRRVAMPADSDIYIMSHAQCTAVLVECGFLSNPQESVLLNSDSYKLKIATVMAGTLKQYLEDINEDKDSFLLHRMWQ